MGKNPERGSVHAPPGLYEQAINHVVTDELAEIPEDRKTAAPIDPAEAAQVLSRYLFDVVEKGLENVLDNGGVLSAQVELVNRVVDLIQNTTFCFKFIWGDLLTFFKF